MLIALISDTHLTSPSPWLKKVYATYLDPADVLLHTGDITDRAVWSFFMQHPRFYAACGNMDMLTLGGELPHQLSFTHKGLCIGLIHGFGFTGRKLSADVAKHFGPDYDLVCFGHTHQPEWIRYGQTWVANAGSLQEKNEYSTLAHIHVKDDMSLHFELISV